MAISRLILALAKLAAHDPMFKLVPALRQRRYMQSSTRAFYEADRIASSRDFTLLPLISNGQRKRSRAK
jgi:hypothetical protein